MAEKPVECSVPTHNWEKISNGTSLPILFRSKADVDILGDVIISVFRCTRCKVLRFFSNK